MAAIFGEKFFFFDILFFLDTLWVKNFDEIALSRTVKKLAKILCFAVFAKKTFLDTCTLDFLDTLRVNIFDEIALIAPLRSWMK